MRTVFLALTVIARVALAQGTDWTVERQTATEVSIVLPPGSNVEESALLEIGAKVCGAATCEVRFSMRGALVASIIHGKFYEPGEEPPEVFRPGKEKPAIAVEWAGDGTERIPLSFQPESIQKLFVRLSGKPRGEFETSEAYRTRVASLAGGWYAFRLSHGPSPKGLVQLGDESGVEVTYEADEGAFRVLLSVDDYLHIDDDSGSLAGIDVARTRGKASYYTGQTAMGAKTTVQKSSVTYYGVAFQAASTISGVMEFRLPIPIERASVVKKNLAFLLVCHTVARASGLTGTTEEYQSPGFDHPFDISIHHHYIFVDIVNLWAYDKETGEILAKVP